MDEQKIKNVVEAAMFAAGRPMSMNEILRLYSEDERPDRETMREIIGALKLEYEGRGIELVEVASGYRIQVKQNMGEWLGRLTEKRPPRYSRALMETLALIAYRQPITRGDIEDVRGVSVSTNIIRTLLERGWVRIVGHRDVPGRPAMFGTAKEFLDYFNLKTLDELPSLAEIQDIDSVNAELDFGEPPYDDVDDVEQFDNETGQLSDEIEFVDGEIQASTDESEPGDEVTNADAVADDDDDENESDSFADDDIEALDAVQDSDDDDEDEEFDGWGMDDDDDEQADSGENLKSVSA